MKKGMGLKRLLSWTLCICMCLSTCVFGAPQVRATDGAADSVQDAADAPQEPTIVHDHTDWAAWRGETVDGNIASGNYYLAEDLTLSQTAYAVLGEVTLCLNGHTLYVGSSQISINSGATLTLTDCGEGGAISGGTKGPVIVNGGTFVMEGGSISGNTDRQGGGVSVNSGTFIMKGGSISDNNADGSGVLGGGVSLTGGTFIMEDGSISGNGGVSGGGIYVAGGDFIMRGGTISGNNAGSATGTWGVGVYVATGTFTMEGGTISDNNGATYGGGVSVINGSFVMRGGTISRNSATYGGGVYIKTKNNSTFTMENGEISGNTANTYGGGVYAENSVFTMKGGTISGNTAENGAGGVYVTNGSFIMQSGTISGNEAKNVGGGIYAANGSTFTMENGSISGNTSTGSGGGAAVDGSECIMRDGTITNNEASAGGGGVHINGGTFTMGSGTISENRAQEAGGVYIKSGSTFTMENGTISDNNATSRGGGIYINGYTSEAVFIMKDGTISGNSAASLGGGGIYMENQSTVLMESGTISKNTATFARGGGVCIIGGSFTMESGTISENTEVNGDGGGVAVTGGSFTMESGTISKNTATRANGGGIYLNGLKEDAVFTMKGGAISGNKVSTFWGGGIYMTNKSTALIENGTISENAAPKGGGVCVDGGTFGVSGAPVITGNTLTDDGTESNVCLVKETEYIHVTGELTDGAKLGVNRLTDVKQTPVLTAGYGDFHTDDAGQYFFYDNAESNGNCGVGTGLDGEAWFGYHVTFKDKNAQTLGEQFVGYNGTASPWPLGSGDGTWATDIGGAPFDFSTPVTANLTLYTDRELAHADGPVVEKSKAQVKMTRTSATTVAERFQFRVISKISDADWNAYFANTGSNDPQAAQKNAITELGFVVYKGIQGFDMETAQAAAKAGHDQGDYTVATTNYIRHIDGSDAEFAARIEITSLASNSDVTYIAFVKYLDADGKEAYAFYETAGTALLSANYDNIVSAYLAAFPFGE